MALLAAMDAAIAETEAFKKKERENEDQDDWDESSSKASGGEDEAVPKNQRHGDGRPEEKQAKLNDTSDWDDDDDPSDAKKDARSPQHKYAVGSDGNNRSQLDETKESNWDSSGAEDEAEQNHVVGNVLGDAGALDATQDSNWDSDEERAQKEPDRTNLENKKNDDGETAKQKDGSVGSSSKEEIETGDVEQDDNPEETAESHEQGQMEDSEKDVGENKDVDASEADEAERSRDKCEEVGEMDKTKDKEDEDEDEDENGEEEEEVEDKDKEEEEEADSAAKSKEEEFQLFDDISAPAPPQPASDDDDDGDDRDGVSNPSAVTVGLCDEALPPLPPLPVKAPLSPGENMKLSSMLASDHGIRASKDSEFLLPEEEEERERSASDLLFHKLPPIKKSAYRPPKVNSDDDFDSVLEAAAPETPSSSMDMGPPKLEVRETSTGHVSLAVEEGAGVMVVGPPGSYMDEVAGRLASLLNGKLVAAQEVLGDVDEKEKEKEKGEGGGDDEESDKSSESDDDRDGTERVWRVIAELPPSPQAYVISHFPWTLAEAQAATGQLAATTASKLRGVLLLGVDTDADALLERLGMVEDEDGERVKDADFDEEQTRGVMEAFKAEGAKMASHFGALCFQVDADGSEEEVWERVQLAMSSVLKRTLSFPKPPTSASGSTLTPASARALGSGSFFNADDESEEEDRGEEGGAEGGEEGGEKKPKEKKERLKEQYDKDMEREKKEKEEKKIIGDGMAGAELNAIGEEEEEGKEEEEDGEEEDGEIQEGEEEEDEGEDEERTKKAKEKEKSKEEIEFEKAQKMWDAMPSQVIEDKSHIGFTQQTTIPDGPDFLLRYEQAVTFFKHMDRSEVQADIRTHAPPKGCMAVLKARVFGPNELSSEALQDERELMLCIGKTGLGQGRVREGEEGSVDDPDVNSMHLRMLQTSFCNLTGQKEPARRIGAHWERIGYQGSDPGTDLRDLGMFSVLQLLWLSTTHVRTCKKIFRFAMEDENEMGAAGHGFPFATALISFSRICLEAMRCGSVVPEMNRRGSVESVLHDLFLGMLMEFYKEWRSKEMSITNGDYQGALGIVEKRALHSPASVLRTARDGHLYTPAYQSAAGGDGEFTDFS